MAQINITMSYSGKNLTKSLTTFIGQLASDVEKEAMRHTPIKTGNARRNWTKSVRAKDFDVTNKVPYIERLEAGASRQAPKGIIGPTLTAIKGKYK